MTEVEKVVIPAAGLGTRFLPITKILAKEFLPLVDWPMISYSVKEAKDSGIKQVVFVLSENKKGFLDYFKKNAKLEDFLENRNQKEAVETLQKITQDWEKITFSSVLQPIPKGDGDAVLKAKNQVSKQPFAVIFPDDIFVAQVPVLSQLIKVFQTSQKPVVALKRVPPEKFSAYGMMQVEKIASRLFKIKGLVEKPKINESPSDLAICGRFVFTPEIFGYLTKAELTPKGEVILAEAIKAMIKDGKVVYGYEIEGEWLECGRTIDWLKSNIFLCLTHSQYGPVIRGWLKNLNIKTKI